MRWVVLTGEYPPQPGGVSDYTRVVARALAAAGDALTVFAPPCADAAAPDPGVDVHRLPDHYGPRSIRAITRALARSGRPRRLLVQYVPHAFGWRALNLPFCWWLRSLRSESVWVIFHEVAYRAEPGEPLRRNVLGVANRAMAAMVGAAAERAFIAIPGWEPDVRSIVSPTTPVTWVPVPSAIDVVDAPARTAGVRARLAGRGPVVGHFGTYGDLTRPLLEDAVMGLMQDAEVGSLLLIGRGSDAMATRLGAAVPEWRHRITGVGTLPPDEVSIHLSAADVMIQPYPDGVSSRRTSVMAALSHGRTVVTTEGWLTEPFWSTSGAVLLSPVGDMRALGRQTAALARDAGRCRRMGDAARALYESTFAVSRTVAALTGHGDGVAALGAAS